MKLKQLLSPAVLEWNLKNEHLPDEQLLTEFNKWAIDNKDMINESVENNLDKINECIKRGKMRAKLILENEEGKKPIDWSSFDDWGDDEENGDGDTSSEEESPISDEDVEEMLMEKEILSNDVPEDDDRNIYTHINILFDYLEANKLLKNKNTIYWNNCDVSKVTDMTALFAFTEMRNANLRSWDVSRVRHMEGMFYKSTFNNDSICKWDVGNCADFLRMFTFSDFNQDLSFWKPAFIEKPEYEADGTRAKNPDGTFKVIKVRADLPLIGAAADEKKEKIKSRKFSKFRYALKKSLEESNENNLKNMKHIVDFNTFVNEGFGDFVKRGVDKVKSFFKSIALKINNFVAIFDNKGEIVDASSPYTALNFIADGKVEGVTAFTTVKNEYLNDNVQSLATIEESPEYYGFVDKNSIEYKNFLTMCEMLGEKYNKDGEMLNEAGRVGFSAADGGIKIKNVNSEKLVKELKYAITHTPGYVGNERRASSLFIWGAPGIGKTTIPKSIIKAWNENSDINKKKALMVVQCGDLTVDGFSLPMPFTKSLGEYLEERPNLRKKLNISDEELLKREIKVSGEAVKTWVPCFKPSTDPVENKIRKAVANGYITLSDSYNEETGEYDTIVNETTEGGILLFDEFFRADPHVFKILMQILENREFLGHVIGDKWAIVCCSNRPNDDAEAKSGFKSTGAVVGTRIDQMNFVPSFDEWKKWAQKEGMFDSDTLKFLMQDVDVKTGEYANWHTIDPDKYTSGESAWPTPRSWSKMMVKLRNIMEMEGYDTVLDVPREEIVDIASGFVGIEMAEKYAEYLETRKGNKVVKLNPSKVINDPDYVIPEGVKCAIAIDELSKEFNVSFDKNNPPSDEQLMNIFNALERRFNKDVDNHVKYFYISIYEKLDFFGDPNAFAYDLYPNFHKAITTKYDLDTPKKMRNFLN